MAFDNLAVLHLSSVLSLRGSQKNTPCQHPSASTAVSTENKQLFYTMAVSIVWATEQQVLTTMAVSIAGPQSLTTMVVSSAGQGLLIR
jgi:uncharacterized membrane protein